MPPAESDTPAAPPAQEGQVISTSRCAYTDFRLREGGGADSSMASNASLLPGPHSRPGAASSSPSEAAAQRRPGDDLVGTGVQDSQPNLWSEWQRRRLADTTGSSSDHSPGIALAFPRLGPRLVVRKSFQLAVELARPRLDQRPRFMVMAS